ncbi:hypothetical protein EVAR_11968_1 [Eumeta japonica]|uniref:Uncharacterized protein n=1 Tax=Eumeta variegata TaxID=151549 RepID=A0A4C1U4Z2_EUMVA|nr:hypothetical protein EVAR_11968_1 [Eumeta japonica]
MRRAPAQGHCRRPQPAHSHCIHLRDLPALTPLRGNGVLRRAEIAAPAEEDQITGFNGRPPRGTLAHLAPPTFDLGRRLWMR